MRYEALSEATKQIAQDLESKLITGPGKLDELLGKARNEAEAISLMIAFAHDLVVSIRSNAEELTGSYYPCDPRCCMHEELMNAETPIPDDCKECPKLPNRLRGDEDTLIY